MVGFGGIAEIVVGEDGRGDDIGGRETPWFTLHVVPAVGFFDVVRDHLASAIGPAVHVADLFFYASFEVLGTGVVEFAVSGDCGVWVFHRCRVLFVQECRGT